MYDSINLNIKLNFTILLKIFIFLLVENSFTILCWFLLYTNTNQS